MVLHLLYNLISPLHCSSTQLSMMNRRHDIEPPIPVLPFEVNLPPLSPVIVSSIAGSTPLPLTVSRRPTRRVAVRVPPWRTHRGVVLPFFGPRVQHIVLRESIVSVLFPAAAVRPGSPVQRLPRSVVVLHSATQLGRGGEAGRAGLRSRGFVTISSTIGIRTTSVTRISSAAPGFRAIPGRRTVPLIFGRIVSVISRRIRMTMIRRVGSFLSRSRRFAPSTLIW